MGLLGSFLSLTTIFCFFTKLHGFNIRLNYIRDINRRSLVQNYVSDRNEVDVNMISTYSTLAQTSIEAFKNLPERRQIFFGVAGGPGSGKSTLCEKVAQMISTNFKIESVVIPMDGFHFSRNQLCSMDPPDASNLLPKRGSPETFDAEAFYNSLADAKLKETKQFPTYSRVKSDPIAQGVTLLSDHRIVFVEGNYLLLGNLVNKLTNDLKLQNECSRWKPLLSLFDETWFVRPIRGVQEQRERLIKRHLETWSDAKTVMWDAADAREGATKRTDFNDVPNAKLVDQCAPYANRIIESK